MRPSTPSYLKHPDVLFALHGSPSRVSRGYVRVGIARWHPLALREVALPLRVRWEPSPAFRPAVGPALELLVPEEEQSVLPAVEDAGHVGRASGMCTPGPLRELFSIAVPSRLFNHVLDVSTPSAGSDDQVRGNP